MLLIEKTRTFRFSSAGVLAGGEIKNQEEEEESLWIKFRNEN